MVHGSMDRASSFRRVAARLRDWTVVTYDRRGYAGSADSEPSAVFAIRWTTCSRCWPEGTVVGVGHSLGGDVVLAAASGGPT